MAETPDVSAAVDRQDGLLVRVVAGACASGAPSNIEDKNKQKYMDTDVSRGLGRAFTSYWVD
jgi:hypothetical protein